MHSHSRALSPLLMASEMSNKTPALSWVLLGCGRQGRDLSASHSPKSFAQSPSRSAAVLGALTGAFPFEITDNLAAGTWVGVGGKKPCLVLRAELPGAPRAPVSNHLLQQPGPCVW